MPPDESERIVAELFRSSYAFFVRLVMRRAGNLDRAEELVQDALVALYEELRRGGYVREPKAWLATVLYRMLAKEYHRRNREAELLDTIEALQGDARVEPADGACDGELEQLLDVLTPREREVVLLRADSHKYREIALLLGISKNSVNTLLARALKKLHGAARGERPARPAQRAGRNLRRPLQ